MVMNVANISDGWNKRKALGGQRGRAGWTSSEEESPRAQRGKRRREREGIVRALLPADRDDDGHETRFLKRINSQR